MGVTEFEQAFARNLKAELDPASQLCPFCCRRFIIPGTPAAASGVCPTCYARARAEATRAATAEMAARREMAAARKAKHDEAKRKARGHAD